MMKPDEYAAKFERNGRGLLLGNASTKFYYCANIFNQMLMFSYKMEIWSMKHISGQFQKFPDTFPVLREFVTTHPPPCPKLEFGYPRVSCPTKYHVSRKSL
jgi:hypothetical protein